MIGREKRVLLRHYLEQGLNKAAIARDLGISRRTVHHWIKTGQLDRDLDEELVAYGPRRAMPSKLDPYKPLIDAHLGSIRSSRPCGSSRKSGPLAIRAATTR